MRRDIIIIGGRAVGKGKPVFIIAEAGVNHNGDFLLARKLIDAAAEAGADAIKFQTFNPDELVTKTAAKAGYQKMSVKEKEGQHAMLKELTLRRENHVALKSYAEKRGLLFLSTPFSLSDALFLKELGVPALKVSSGDLNNIPYLSRIAVWGLPVILSTGMANMEEIRESIDALKRSGNKKIIVLQCTTNYPTSFEETNLRAIETLRKELRLLVGFSDHTLGDEAALAAVALGASLIEKHFTLNRKLPGPDHKASLEPQELRAFIQRIRNVEKALGTGKKIPFKSERKIAKVVRKSVVALRPVKKGGVFTEANLGIKRPGTGLPPKEYDKVIGTRATRDITTDTLIRKHDYAS